MFGSNSAFGSSDSADTDMIKSSESESDADTGESDKEDHPVTDLSLGKPTKLVKVDKICPFRCSQDGFIVCTYCSKAVINVDACSRHINKYHKSQASWLDPLPLRECSNMLTT